jgi:hypothetical protein
MTAMARARGTTPAGSGRLRGATAPLRVIPGRRGVPTTVTVRQSVLDDLRDELCAAGSEMEALGHRVEYAIVAERPDVALHVAGRLVVLGADYRERGRGRIR